MSLKKQLTELDVKLKALHFRVNRSNEIIEKGDRSAVERQRESIQTLVSTINCLKGSIEEAKFGQSESESDVEQWSQDIDARVATADQCCEKLYNFVKEIETKAKELELAKTHDQVMMFEKQILEQKLEAAVKTKSLQKALSDCQN